MADAVPTFASTPDRLGLRLQTIHHVNRNSAERIIIEVELYLLLIFDIFIDASTESAESCLRAVIGW